LSARPLAAVGKSFASVRESSVDVAAVDRCEVGVCLQLYLRQQYDHHITIRIQNN
jgi:hypothetical protein